MLRAWHRLGHRYARRGLGRVSHEPTEHWIARISSRLPADAAQTLSALSARFVAWRYAGGIRDAVTAKTLARDLRKHRPAPRFRE